MPRIRPTVSLAIAIAVLGASAGAAFASRAGIISLPLVGSQSQARAANQAGNQAQEPETNGDDTPRPPASGVETSSTGDSPPVVQAVINGPEGDGGWYVGDVTLEWIVTDDEMPDVTTNGCEPVTVDEDTTGAVFTCEATSEGGTTTTVATIARDTTAPSGIAVAAVPEAVNGWHTQPFAAAWSGTDATSGIAACTTTEYSGPDTANATLDGTCTDRAGNESETVAYSFAYDATAPVVRAVPDREPDANGWYNHAVSIAWVADDEDATCDPATTYNAPDGDAISLGGTCTDPAGNTGSATFALRYDSTPPVVTILSPSAPSYVLRQPVTVRFSCVDATSGIDACDGTQADGARLDTAAVGPHSLSVSSVDQAGNRAAARHDYAVTYSPAGVRCGGVAGHQILEPIRADGTSSVNGNSTVPAKFRVCDYFGTPVTSSGVVSSFRIVGIDGAAADAPVPSTSSHEEFRSGDSQWIFNVNVKSLRGGSVYDFKIALDDGTAIPFRFTVAKSGRK